MPPSIINMRVIHVWYQHKWLKASSKYHHTLAQKYQKFHFESRDNQDIWCKFGQQISFVEMVALQALSLMKSSSAFCKHNRNWWKVTWDLRNSKMDLYRQSGNDSQWQTDKKTDNDNVELTKRQPARQTERQLQVWTCCEPFSQHFENVPVCSKIVAWSNHPTTLSSNGC